MSEKVDIEQVREALESATAKGNWKLEKLDMGTVCHIKADDLDERHIVTSWNDYRGQDATLIANAPQWLRQMADELEQLRDENRTLNRRVAIAEGECKTTIEDCERQGVSLGRSLAKRLGIRPLLTGGNDDIR